MTVSLKRTFAALLFCLPLAVGAHEPAATATRATTSADAASATVAPAQILIAGELAQPLTLDRAALAALPRQRVEANDHGRPGVWEGVAVSTLLEKAGAPLGDKLRGRNLSGYLIVSAADGYNVVFALAEFDAAFGASTAILADTRDGQPLNDHEGPLRLIGADEKRPGRWVRQVNRIDLRFAGGATK